MSNLAVRLTTPDLNGITEWVVAWGTLFAVSAVGSLAFIAVMGTYLRISNRWFKMHDNEAYSARRSGDNRHFARLRISPDGTLSCYIVAITETGSGWAKALRTGGQLPPPSVAPPQLLETRFRTQPNQPPESGRPSEHRQI